MKCWSLFIFSSLLSQYAESCSTPLGVQSQCISVNDCASFVSAFQMKNLSLYSDFIRKSLCGYKNYSPQVCCGPLPVFDPVSSTDSFPAPPGTCGVNGLTDKILQGQDTNLDDYPWMTLLGYLGNTQTLTFQCGGALINQRYVLTAAHCTIGAIEKEYGKPVLVRLGEYDLTKETDCQGDICAKPVQDIFITSIHPHNLYSDDTKNYHHDIALLRLAKRAELNNYVKPICLIEKDMQLAADTKTVVAGWGQTLSAKKSNVKQKLPMAIYDKVRCVNLFRSHRGKPLINSQICAGGIFKEDTCHGDSGGPMMIQNSYGFWEVAGIVSYGYGCGMDGVPGIYTAVSSYVDWILSTLESTNV